MGIEASFLPYVFHRFAQADTSRSRAHGGLGLGLAIVRHLLDLHNGTVHAESAGAGQGSTFWVTVPLVNISRSTFPPEISKNAAVPAVGAEPPAAKFSELRDVGILVLDDDSGVRDAVAEVLNGLGARVRVAKSAAEAMTAIDELRPEVLLCDIAMPEEDGYSFLQRLRARGPEGGGDIPALALTALVREGDRARAFAAGFQMHLTKPVEVERLKRAVIELVTGATRAQSGASL